MIERIVVVGAGQAGAELVASLRAGGFAGALTLIGEEPAAPYQRPPLSKKYLLGEMDAGRLLLKPDSFYAEHGVELLTGVRVAAIDRAARAVRLIDGRALSWDRLALTTGARPRRLPAVIGGDQAGVHVMRTLADADALAPAIQPGARLLVVGGGYIGLEAAAVAAARGMAVTLIEAAPRILGRVASAETADFFRALHAAHGVTIREGVGIAALDGADGRLTGARLADGGFVPADVAIVGIGVVPNAELAQAAGLAVDDGIVVDAHGATSDPAIFAAGDVARFPWRGAPVRLESVQNAIDQAKAVAAAMLAQPIPYDPIPWFWSDQYDVKLQIAGLNRGYDRVITRPGAREGGLSVWYFAGAQFLAVDAMNDARAYMTGKRWLEAGAKPDPAKLADATLDLRAAA
jgi:3-phenylpropionate/trans-cinnamate dioxygenase ferredoxin reductase subunit